ncbi:FHA domain-containing protein [Cutibacterium granulosum]|uniref:FHA domain-containing protein n=1 Tax=Cutibacterium granulosum TaxID=33011 RepID=UPI0029050094|nr:FHA domain-containing protein [Cutibacterium granulosum]MDU1524426.1 FHA domain-containing protein [Cutibacterium granulosum]MDU4678779.1 FHA domain-containing protein [Cutibacterium granulosum]MDU7727195.1 FHA domain-containing protein [Cutibacterium granulosum]
MTQSFGAWRASYTPGSWVVLAGASSLVIMQPAAPRHAELVASIWDHVVQAVDVEDLVSTLTTIGLSQMPSMAMFFWRGRNMWSLARGNVVVRDSQGDVVNSGEGLLTWNETVLDPSVIRVEMDEEGAEGLEMPLMLGVAMASTVTIDATGTAQVLRIADDQPRSADDQRGAADRQLPNDGDTFPDHDDQIVDDEPPAGRSLGASTSTGTHLTPLPSTDESDLDAPMPARSMDSSPSPESEVTGGSSDEQGSTVPTDEDVAELFGNTNEESWDDEPAPRGRPVLISSTGEQADLDGPVLVGRAPSTENDDADIALMKVHSPAHDISRSHAMIAPSRWGFDVIDMDSTNGTVVEHPDGEEIYVDAGRTVGISAEDTIQIGDGVTLHIEYWD